jgi:predicted nucleotide-binding protein
MGKTNSQPEQVEKPKIETSQKRAYVSQSDIPGVSLEESLKIAQAIYDNFGGRPVAPHQVAVALGISPTSSVWNLLPGASIAYGLTNGGKNANEMSLAELGRKIVAPEEEGDDDLAKIEACLKPRIIREFYERYNKGKFPKDTIAQNVLVSMGVPKEKVSEVYSIIHANGIYTNIIQDTKTGPFVFIDKSKSSGQASFNGQPNESNSVNGAIDEIPQELANRLAFTKPVANPISSTVDSNQKPKVFISHGKNKKIVEQLKEILTFGQFEVVISVEKESTAIPVPEKVFADMRECNAAVIHVEGELELLDREGNIHNTINQNVLIEIGAAIALYGKQFILLCEHSLKLPSNLQGLYRCNYEGKELTYEATIKLLKSFNEFREASK